MGVTMFYYIDAVLCLYDPQSECPGTEDPTSPNMCVAPMAKAWLEILTEAATWS